MTLSTLFAFLIGRREAILTVARTRGAWLLGLLFVLAAGFAREYDGEDLLSESWHLALPLAASLATSLLLYGLIVLVVWRRSGLAWPVARGYLSFVALYWLTAPLAWLYAIPYERFLSPADAVWANLATLAVVSLWRVLLMTRVVSVVFQSHFAAALMIVMLFADAVALTLLEIVPLPIFSIMGGIRLTESEQVLLQVACNVRIAGILSLPVWVIGTLSLFFFRRRQSGPWTPVAEFAASSEQVAWSTWILAISLLIAGVALLPTSQREQQLRRQVETALTLGNVQQGIAIMSAHERDDFPPHWDPPPRIGFGQHEPRLVDVLEAIAKSDTPPWVEEVFISKIVGQADVHFFFEADDRVLPNPATMSESELQRYFELLQRLPAGSAIAQAQRRPIEHALDHIASDDPHAAGRRHWLTKLFDLAESKHE